MRSLTIIVVLLLVTVSCHPVIQLGRRPVATSPFVQLKDGTVIRAKEAGQEMEFQRGMIVADEQAFPRKRVLVYSNGEQTFANLGKGNFGPKIAEGKIEVYSATNAAHYGYANHDFNHLYIRDSGSSALLYMKYRALKRMIPHHTAAAQQLVQFKKTRTIFRLTSLAGVACFVGGTVIAGKGVTNDKGNSRTNTGMAMIFGGMGIMAGTSIPLFTNKMKLRRAIAIHNGVHP